MNGLLSCRAASKADLPEILRLYAQPDLDDGKVLPLSESLGFERHGYSFRISTQRSGGR